MTAAYRQGFLDKLDKFAGSRLLKEAGLGSWLKDVARMTPGYFDRLLGISKGRFSRNVSHFKSLRSDILGKLQKVRTRPEFNKLRADLKEAGKMLRYNMHDLASASKDSFKTRFKTGLGLAGLTGAYGIYANSRPDPDEKRWFGLYDQE